MRPPTLLGTLFLTLLTATVHTAPVTRAEYEQAYAAAETARGKAAKVGGEWRDTASLLRRARELAAEGQLDDAVALARRALREGELGYAQALEGEKAEPRF